MDKSKGLSYLEAAAVVLKDGGSMTSKEIVHEIQRRQLTPVAGDTPWNTINARISEDIVKYGKESRFIRAESGLYALRMGFTGEEYIVPEKQKASLYDEVLVFPAGLVDEIGYFSGVLQDFEPYRERLLNPNLAFFMPRLKAEETESVKQIVSYVIVRHRDKLLRFTRGKITTIYKYLYGEYSIGFGGHVDRKDWDLFSLEDAGFLRSVMRELREEIGVDLENWSEDDYELRTIGVLNDDSSPLGRRHFAFVLLLDVKTDEFRKGHEFDKGEKSVNDLKLIELDSLSNDFAGYEKWSKHVIVNLFSGELETTCHILSTSNFRLAQHIDYVLIVGFIGSGKTEACKVLEAEFGYELIPCSRIMQELLDCEPIETIGRKALQDEGLRLVSQPGGHKHLADAIVTAMRSTSGNRFVLDGLRYMETLNEIEKILGAHLTTIYIETTLDTLHKNYQAREGEILNLKEYIEVISHPVEKAVDRFTHRADIVIYNHGSLSAFLLALQEFFANEIYPL